MIRFRSRVNYIHLKWPHNESPTQRVFMDAENSELYIAKVQNDRSVQT